mgnify:CR=1 FL=1
MTPAEKNQQIQLMVQSLLKDRMKLKVHLEKREETIYALEVAKGGMKLAPAKEGVPQRFGVTHHGQNYASSVKRCGEVSGFLIGHRRNWCNVMIQSASMHKLFPGRNLSLTLVALMALAAPKVMAQAQATLASKPLGFEVASIRPTKCDPENKSSFGPTPDGFRMINRPLIGLFQIAYVPTGMGDSGFFRGSRISGPPDWLS